MVLSYISIPKPESVESSRLYESLFPRRVRKEYSPYDVVYVVSVDPLESFSRKAHSNYVGINICAVELRKPSDVVFGPRTVAQPRKTVIIRFCDAIAHFQPCGYFRKLKSRVTDIRKLKKGSARGHPKE